MAPHRTRPALLAAVTSVLVLALALPATADDGDRYRAPTSRADRAPSGQTFVGLDGKTYQTAPLLVRGKKGTRYFGEEFNAACGYGPRFSRALGRLRSLAKMVERSGRTVVFTVGPNKSAVNLRDLRMKRLPHGRCDKLGLEEQNQTLDKLQDRLYLPMRAPLARIAAAKPSGRQLYWPIDTHWTSLATAKYAVALAQRLSPKVAAVQTFQRGQETIQTDLSTIGLYPENYETGPALFSSTKVQMTPPNKEDPFIWDTKPAKRTIPHRTLLVGDSFTYRGLTNLRPLFRHGRFLWITEDNMDAIAEAIPQADTVVFEVVQRWLPISPLLRRSFKRQLAATLAAE